MEKDKWYDDIHAGELINLKNCKGIWIHRDQEKTNEHSAKFTLQLAYYGKTNGTWLHYESSKLLNNAYDHYKTLLGCVELDVSTKPVTL